MTNKERMQIERVKMNELAPEYRVKTRLEEVAQGLTREQAVLESERCLNCKNPGCMQGCPVGIHIPEFISHIQQEDFAGAAEVIRQSSTLPAVCGRVCPQEKQCESQCIYLKTGRPAVAIGYLERFVADEYNKNLNAQSANKREAINAEGNKRGEAAINITAKKIAVIGSGPAGLAFAGDMAKYGYDVTVFEALHEIGGVLKYGIPEFRLPNRIVDIEIEGLRALGVKFMTNTIVGKTITVDELMQEGYAGIFVASGAGLPRFMNIPGENLIGVMSSNEYLTRVNLMGAAEAENDTPVFKGKKVVVVGGGNTAMDSVRTALRLGADASIIYRRSEDEMPARLEEVHHAKEEGVHFLTLHNPVEYLGDEQGHVRAVRLQVMELGEPDASGRRSPVPVEGKIVEMECDEVIVAIGVSPNPIIPQSVAGLEISRKGTIVVDDDLRSNIPTLFAGGDIVRGGATVILAMSDGRKAAAKMHEQLSK